MTLTVLDSTGVKQNLFTTVTSSIHVPSYALARTDGTALDTGTGAGSTSTLRVTMGTDQVPVAGQATSSGSIPVTLPSDVSASVAVTITKASSIGVNPNQIIGASTSATAAITFANMGLSGSRIMLTSAQLEIDSTSVPTNQTSFNAFLFNVTPPSSVTDGSTTATSVPLSTSDRAVFLGQISLGTPALLGSTLYTESNGINKQLKLSGTSLFAYVTTASSYTPSAANTNYVVTLHAVQL